jgi:dTDP-4-amino-4,6-dideoxygalactose transaminase
MPAEMEERPGGEIWNYQQSSLGYNYRLTDIQAALGTSQLERIDEFVDSRHRIARRYDEELAGLPITVPWEHPDSYSANHLYIVRLQLDKTSRNQQQIYEFLREQGIGVNLHYIPIYLQPYYERIGFERGYCPEAEKYYSEALTIPLYPTMTEQQQGKVISALAAATI